MQIPLFVRPLMADEWVTLETGLRSCEALTVRNAIHAFKHWGVTSLQPRSSRPHKPRDVFDARGRERLRTLLHQSPCTFGQSTSVWTLALAAEVSFAQGSTCRQVNGEAIDLVLKPLGVRWKRAKHWITSPDPAYVRKKPRDRLIRLARWHPIRALG